MGKTNIKQEYRKIMTRPHDLIANECWDIGERIMLPKRYKDLLFFDPLFIYQPGKGDTVYFNFTDPKQNLAPLIKYLENNIEWLLEIKKEFDNDCGKVRELISSNTKDYQKLFSLIKEIWPTITIANVLGSTEIYEVSQKLRDICLQIRHDSDDVLHSALMYLSKLISQEIEKNYPTLASYASNVLISEYMKGEIPKEEELRKRANGYLFHKGEIVFDIETYLAENNFKLVEYTEKNIDNTIKGSVACAGKVKGEVRIIFELADLSKVQEGDILVTPMTTPDMMIALHKAAAIITDEGGITCHAAIVSRELKKPCIIGTKIATQVLKDGDSVEVDAEKGLIILNKK